MKLFFNYSIDCELPPNTHYTQGAERRAFFHGPLTWAFAEASVRGFIERMHAAGVTKGATLFVYPDVAREQRKLYREMADAGVEIALHLNGLRYSRLTGDQAMWLGEMNYEQQHAALRMAKQDLEDSIEQACLGYRACYGSANNDTFAICESLGFTWGSNSSGRCRPEFFADWTDSFPYAHRAHRQSNRLVGDLDLVEFPVTRGLSIFFDGNPDQPLDLRVETPLLQIGEQRERLRDVMEENLREMQRRAIPLQAIIGASHNTSAYGDDNAFQAQTLQWIVRHARSLASDFGLDFVPASFTEMLAETRAAGRA